MMKKLIEPCCAGRHMLSVRDAIGTKGTMEIEGYDDLSLTELLPAILTRYAETELMIVAPTLPDQATEVIATWMRRTIARMDGNGRLNYIRRLTIVSDLSEAASPDASAWLNENPYGERLVLHDMRQDATAILLPDFAIEGPVNMRYGKHFIATAYGKREDVDGLWTKYREMVENAPEEKGADMPETVETEENGQPAEETAGTATEDTAKTLPVAPPMARRADGGATKRMRFRR
jgi:hypothetical protein